MENKQKELRNFLNVYWLRPETALWRSIDVEAMKNFSFESPSLDLGCGDGIFSFIRAGGSFNLDFDAFQSVDMLDKFFDKVDVYDCFKDNIHPNILNKPKYMIDYGFDHKENLLKKAQTLNLYKTTIVGDASMTLPFADNSLRSVFSNIIYWLENPQHIFNEISRVLDVGGKCCVMLPNSNLAEFSFYYNLVIKQNKEQFSFLELLDRGRMSDNIKQAKSMKEWKVIINNSNLKIIKHKMHLSKTIIQIWDIGLRPIFPLLYKMTSHLSNDELLQIKKQWIETFMMFLEPLLENDFQLNLDVEPAFHCFILEKE